MQHVHRGRRPGGDGRPRRNHLFLPGGAPPCTPGSTLGESPVRVAVAPHRSRGCLRRRSADRRRRSPALCVVGNQPRTDRSSDRPYPSSRRFRRSPGAGLHHARIGLHGSGARHSHHRDHHRSGLFGLMHQRPDRGPAQRRCRRSGKGRCTPRSRPWWSPGQDWSNNRPRRKAWTSFSNMPDSSGETPVVRCAWA